MSKADNKFPVIGATGLTTIRYVRWDKLDEEWAMRIHSQTLETLASRGGLCEHEIYLNLHRLPWHTNVRKEQAAEAVDSIKWTIEGKHD